MPEGFGIKQNEMKFFFWLQKKKANIIFLQETHSTKEIELIWKNEWGGDILFSHNNSQARGAAILFKTELPYLIHESSTDTSGRYVVIDIEINGFRMTICNLYAPNEDNPIFFTELIETIEKLPNDNRIIGGDFNLVLNVGVDKRGGTNRTNFQSQAVIANYMDETELVDIWRFHHPSDYRFTWHCTRPTKISCRLDFFLVSFGMSDKITSSTIGAGFRSDHSPISLKLIPFNCTRGKGYWKLNCSLLYDFDYVKKNKEHIKLIAELNKNAEPRLLWDTIKMSIRGESIKYSSQKKKSINDKIAELENEILNLQDKISSTDENLTYIDELDTKKQELNNYIKIKTKGAIIRSRIQFIEEGEKNSAYFYNLEKRTANLKTISRLELSNNTITEDPITILDEMKNYYAKLYFSATTESPDNFINSLNNPSDIKQEHLREMEKDITENELLQIIKSLPNNKSPGEDGLPAEFYKIFWNDIKSFLLDCYKCSFNANELSITQRRGILSLIPKKADPLKLKNWRPISLLNQDYKILAKTIAERIKLAIPYLINEDQSGFIKGRYIGQNITNIIDLIQYTEDNNIPAILISIDYEKAFDKLEWQFIQKSLTYFKFPFTIKKWVDVLYTNISSCITNNGWQSSYFSIQRGVRQGCPLSPYLFIIASELLAIHIRQDKKIKGICIGEKEFKIKLYADDTQMCLKFEADSIKEMVTSIKIFSSISGLLINFDKSNILRLGPIRNSEIKLDIIKNYKWTNDKIEVLGIKITTNLKNIVDINIDPIITKIGNIISVWSKRKHTLFGKILTINSLFASQLIYRLTVLPTPSEVKMKQIEKQLYDFLWSNKPPKIAKKTITGLKTHGGLKMIDIWKKTQSLKISWIRRISDNPKFSICPILDKYCKIEIFLLLECNLKANDLYSVFQKNIPKFWQNVLSSWCEYNFKKADEITNPRKEIIWFNSNIKVDNMVAFNSDMFAKGILYVGDIMKDNGLLLSLSELENSYGIKMNFLQYYSIIHAIPNTYKQKPAVTLKTMTNLETILKCEKVSKFNLLTINY